MGCGKRANVVYLIDFGLAKKFRDSRANLHIPYRENKQLTGTARYTSINTHIGIEQSRRDDLEAIGYMLVYFMNGSLPWQGLKADSKAQKYLKITECKIRTSVEDLTRDIPVEFRIFLEYCRCLSFTAKPDYAYLRGIFRRLFIRNQYEYDFAWDWTYDLANINHVATPSVPVSAPPVQSKFSRNTRSTQGSQRSTSKTIPTVTTSASTFLGNEPYLVNSDANLSLNNHQTFTADYDIGDPGTSPSRSNGNKAVPSYELPSRQLSSHNSAVPVHATSTTSTTTPRTKTSISSPRVSLAGSGGVGAGDSGTGNGAPPYYGYKGQKLSNEFGAERQDGEELYHVTGDDFDKHS